MSDNNIERMRRKYARFKELTGDPWELRLTSRELISTYATPNALPPNLRRTYERHKNTADPYYTKSELESRKKGDDDESVQ